MPESPTCLHRHMVRYLRGVSGKVPYLLHFGSMQKRKHRKDRKVTGKTSRVELTWSNYTDTALGVDFRENLDILQLGLLLPPGWVLELE